MRKSWIVGMMMSLLILTACGSTKEENFDEKENKVKLEDINGTDAENQNEDKKETDISQKEDNNMTDNTLSHQENDMAEGYVAEGFYQIKSAVNPEYVVDISGTYLDNGINVQLYLNSNGEGQIFYIRRAEENYYIIMAKSSGKVLDAEKGGMESETNIIQYSLNGNGSDNQLWELLSNSDGTYSFRNKLNGLYLDLFGGVAENGRNIQCYEGNDSLAQKFILTKVENLAGNSDIAEGYYQIKSAVNLEYVVDIDHAYLEDGTNVQLYFNNNAENQIFYIKRVEEIYYVIMAKNSEKVLDAEMGGMESGANIIQCSLNGNGSDNQLWELLPNSDGTYSFRNKSNSLYLDLSDGVAENGRNIQCYEGNNTLAQKFILTRVEDLIEDSE